MITLIEARNYRCLHYIKQPLEQFQVMVGPNASGKTTFLDVIGFLSDIVQNGIEAAVTERTANPEDLLWRRQGEGFELAVEAAIPMILREKLSNPDFDRIRYELSVGINIDNQGIGINVERILLKKNLEEQAQIRLLFPEHKNIPKTIISKKGRSKKEQILIVSKESGGNSNYYSETGKGYTPSFPINSKKSALASLPADETAYPVTTWFKTFLSEGIQKFILNSLLIRKASSPVVKTKRFMTDGSNLPWVIDRLSKDKKRFDAWIEHLKTALPELENINTIEREDDKHRYLVLNYQGGLEIPSWMASDGTLRLLALTLPAYIKDFNGCYLIEEPENGIHPRAVESIIQSLSTVYNAQVLLATHSPVILSQIKPKDVLCLSKTEDGETDIVRGDKHPKLIDWQGTPNLSIMFASGVLG